MTIAEYFVTQLLLFCLALLLKQKNPFFSHICGNCSGFSEGSNRGLLYSGKESIKLGSYRIESFQNLDLSSTQARFDLSLVLLGSETGHNKAVWIMYWSSQSEKQSGLAAAVPSVSRADSVILLLIFLDIF